MLGTWGYFGNSGFENLKLGVVELWSLGVCSFAVRRLGFGAWDGSAWNGSVWDESLKEDGCEIFGTGPRRESAREKARERPKERDLRKGRKKARGRGHRKRET